eukprot:8995233-Ditylum_brightwellii.AAC.1
MALEGAHDFNAHPLAPLGMTITVHKNPGQQASWGSSWCERMACRSIQRVLLVLPGLHTKHQRGRIVSTVDFYTTKSNFNMFHKQIQLSMQLKI